MPIHLTHPTTSDTITANLSGAAWVISPRFGVSYSFDRAGRLLGFFIDQRSYQRALDHRVLERLPKSLDGPRRRALDRAESDRLLNRIFADLNALASDLPALELPDRDRAILAEALAVIQAFGPDQLAADGARFRDLYQPVSILPPDQYLALVLQPTQGCSWNRCAFCGLYRDRNFVVRTPDAFRDHCADVRRFYGDGITLRRGIFLADANALVTPMPRLRAFFQIAQEFFALPEGPRPVFSFVSAFDVGRKTPAQWAELRDLGLTRAYIGMETGDDDLLRFLNKPGSAQDAIDAVAALRAGGVAVGIILMAGIGGEQYAPTHVARSVEAVAAMKLGSADQVYLSNYVPAPHTEYEDLAAQAGLRALSASEIDAQLQEMQARVRQLAPQTTVAPYRVDGFAL